MILWNMWPHLLYGIIMTGSKKTLSLTSIQSLISSPVSEVLLFGSFLTSLMRLSLSFVIKCFVADAAFLLLAALDLEGGTYPLREVIVKLRPKWLCGMG